MTTNIWFKANKKKKKNEKEGITVAEKLSLFFFLFDFAFSKVFNPKRIQINKKLQK